METLHRQPNTTIITIAVVMPKMFWTDMTYEDVSKSAAVNEVHEAYRIAVGTKHVIKNYGNQ